MKKKAHTRSSSADQEFLYGVNPLLEALRAGDRVPSEIMLAEGARDERLRELIELAGIRNVTVKRVPRATIDRAVGNTHHQGVLARVARAHYADIDDLMSAIGAGVGSESEPLIVVLDGVEDPRNLGAILRTAECAGVDGVFVPERRAAGLTDAVAKAAAGRPKDFEFCGALARAGLVDKQACAERIELLAGVDRARAEIVVARSW